MFGFQTVPKSKQNGSDFRQCLKSEPFGNGTIMQMSEIQTFRFQMFTAFQFVGRLLVFLYQSDFLPAIALSVFITLLQVHCQSTLIQSHKGAWQVNISNQNK